SKRDWSSDVCSSDLGVIADAKNQGIQEPPLPEVLVPYTITGAFERGILVRTAGNPNAMLNSVRREIWAVDRNVALTLTGTLSERSEERRVGKECRVS